MGKTFLAFCVVAAVGGATLDAASGCGGGGASGARGRARYGGARSVASTKVLVGSPRLEKDGPRIAQRCARATKAKTARTGSTSATTVAVKPVIATRSPTALR
jgi:hypothetical protein